MDAPERWLVNELLPAGVLALVHGEPRARKSWFALELAVSLCTGTQAFGLERFTVPEAVPVLYSSQEDAALRVSKRAQRSCAAAASPARCSGSTSACTPVSTSTTTPGRKCSSRTAGSSGSRLSSSPRSPLCRYSPNVDKGPAEVRAVTSFLRKLSVEAACTVVIVHHDVKPGKEEDTRRRGHRASGGDWFAACEAPIHLEPAGKDASLVVPEDYKFPDDPDSFMFWIEGKAEEPAVRVVAENPSVSEAKMLSAQQKVIEYLSEHPGVSKKKLLTAVKLGHHSDILERLERTGAIDCLDGSRRTRLYFLARDVGNRRT